MEEELTSGRLNPVSGRMLFPRRPAEPCLHGSPYEKVGEEGKPQCVVSQERTKSIVQGKETDGGSCHGQKHGTRGCGADENAVPDEGGDSGYGYGKCPVEISIGGGCHVRVVSQQLEEGIPPKA